MDERPTPGGVPEASLADQQLGEGRAESFRNRICLLSRAKGVVSPVFVERRNGAFFRRDVPHTPAVLPGGLEPV
jgi:hypothetical protein